jgi:hypothetical protein
MFSDLLKNEVLVIPLCAWAIAQVTKVLVAAAHGSRFDLNFLVASGGMPSAHSAIVAALATTLAIQEGAGSVAFGISVIVALIVMYDATGVRQAVSEQSVVLNRIVQEFRRHEPLVKIEADLRELVGHTPFQVYIGAALGIALALVWLFLAGL